MGLQRFTIWHDPQRYCAWPDVALLPDGTLLCVFTACTHHLDRSHSQVMLTGSCDHGRTWTPPRPLTEDTGGLTYYYNCPRLKVLSDGTVAVVVDRVSHTGGERSVSETQVWLYRSRDGGASWEEPQALPLHGIVPDRPCLTDDGRWLQAAHHQEEDGSFHEECIASADGGRTWSAPVTVAHIPGLLLCEASLLDCGHGAIVAFMRENSGRGLDCQKAISHDGGRTWSAPIAIPIPAAHRPVAGWLQDGRCLVTFRMRQGGGNQWGGFQNLMLAVADRQSVLSTKREESFTRIMPVDYDRALQADTGYSGWVQFPDGEIYIVNYIVDDAIDRAQIRGYALTPHDICLG